MIQLIAAGPKDMLLGELCILENILFGQMQCNERGEKVEVIQE